MTNKELASRLGFVACGELKDAPSASRWVSEAARRLQEADEVARLSHHYRNEAERLRANRMKPFDDAELDAIAGVLRTGLARDDIPGRGALDYLVERCRQLQVKADKLDELNEQAMFHD